MFGNFSLFKTPFLGRSSVPTSFISFFVFYIFPTYFLKTMICFFGFLMSSASIQKLFCGIYSAFKCSYDEFVGEKVVSLSYSSAILGLPSLHTIFNLLANSVLSFQLSFSCISFFSHYVKKRECLWTVGGNVNWCSHYRKQYGGEEPRWRRSRTGRTLSPPQIHQKSI